MWAGEHVTLRRDVAVKFLSSSSGSHAEAAQRFAMEGRTLARIQSPHVPQVFDQGESSDGTPYIVIELLEGVNLATWAARHGALDTTQVVRLLDRIGTALGAAHELGIVHRDVKPENIILCGGAGDSRPSSSTSVSPSQSASTGAVLRSLWRERASGAPGT